MRFPNSGVLFQKWVEKIKRHQDYVQWAFHTEKCRFLQFQPVPLQCIGTPFFNTETLVVAKYGNMGVKTLIIISDTYPDILEGSYSYGSRFRQAIYHDFLISQRRSPRLTYVLFGTVSLSMTCLCFPCANIRTSKID
jgi:hypothetical protein